jgi:hypothetical protein
LCTRSCPFGEFSARRRGPILGRVFLGDQESLSAVRIERSAPGQELRQYVATRNDYMVAPTLGDAMGVSRRFDIDRLDRLTVAHNELEACVHAALVAQGWTGGKAPSGVALCDLVMERDGRWLVVEIKTLGSSPMLEQQQLRLGLGQALHYRHRLQALHPHTQAAVVVDRQPADDGWVETMEAAGILLAWPPFAPLLLPA